MGKKYIKTGKSSHFQWRRHQGNGYEELKEDLKGISKKHCFFCDAYPMGSRVPDTIDHFRPKCKFPLLAYEWENLFLSCSNCQGKQDNFHESLLKPDESSYNFDDFFDIDWKTGELIPNMDACPEDQERAEITIKLYKLNHNGKPEDRRKELEKFQDSNYPKIDQWSYRFYIERGLLS